MPKIKNCNEHYKSTSRDLLKIKQVCEISNYDENKIKTECVEKNIVIKKINSQMNHKNKITSDLFPLDKLSTSSDYCLSSDQSFISD